MSVPKYDEMYTEYLTVLSDGTPKARKEIRSAIAKKLNLTSEDLSATYSSGVLIFNNRVSWTGSFLLHAELIQRSARGVYSITPEGKALLNDGMKIDNKFLRTIPAFQAWDSASKKADSIPSAELKSDSTPEETIDTAFQELNTSLADQLMEEIMAHDPTFFERLVVQLLLKMGYSRTNDGQVTQLSGDGGIDGIISEDRLGLSRLYLQAKRWDPNQSVGRPEIQKFSGALRDVGGTKGLFITTAHFTKEACESAKRQSIVLVDGFQLTHLMIEYGLGVSTVATYEVKRLDSDFFSEDN